MSVAPLAATAWTLADGEAKLPGFVVLLVGPVFFLVAYRLSGRRRPSYTVTLERLAHDVHRTLSARLARPTPDGSGIVADLSLVFFDAGTDTAQIAALSSAADRYLAQADPRLVLVGPPGSGKTDTARRLAHTLLERRTGGDRVPVLLRCASWDPAAQPLREWIVQRLTSDYRVSARSAVDLVDLGLVLPVIDGLDELPAAQRGLAVEVLNRLQYGRAGAAYIATCRTEAYDNLGPALRHRLGTAARIQPLHTEQITGFLRGDRRWEGVASAVRARPEGPVAQALSSPWMLTLAMGAYAASEGRVPGELLDEVRFAGVDDVRRRVLDTADPAADLERWSGSDRRTWLETVTDMMGREGDAQLLWFRMSQRRAPEFVWRVLALIPFFLSFPSTRRGWLVAVGELLAMLAAAPFLGMWHPPRPRRLIPNPQWWRVAVGASAGALFGAFLYATCTGGRASGDAATWFGLAVAACSPLAGAALGFVVPDAEPVAGRRVADLTADRRAALVTAVAVTLVLGLPQCAPVLRDALEKGSDPWTAAVTTAMIVLPFFLGVLLLGTCAGRFRLAYFSLSMEDKLPPRLPGFLEEAVREGLLTPAEGYGSGCYAFRHDLIRVTLAERVGSDTPHRAALERHGDEIRDEVLDLPESVAHIGYAAGGDPQRHVRARERVADLARSALDEELPTIAQAAAAHYERFRRAHRDLTAAVRQPWWTRPLFTYLYRFLLWAAVTAGLGSLGARIPGAHQAVSVWDELPALAVVAVGMATSFGWVMDGSGSAGRWATRLRLPAGLVLAAISGTAALGLIDGASTRLAPVPLVSAAVGIVALLAWINARPYADLHDDLASQDPARWPEIRPPRSRYRAAALQARRDWLNTVARDGVMPFLRDRLRADRDAGTLTFPGIDPSRLTGTRGFDQILATDAAEQTAYLLRELESASIGVSGARGAGKSSLMQRFCAPDAGRAAEDLLVLVPAPTSYDPREFLIHLFAEVCRKVTGADSGADGRPGPEPGQRAVRLQRAGAALAVVAGGVIAFCAGLWPDLSDVLGRIWTVSPRWLWLAGGLLLVAVGFGWARVVSRRSATRGHRYAEGRADAAARGHLRMLHYQLTVLRSRTAQLAVPGGLQLAEGAQVQHTEQVLAYPELVARFRSLLDLVALERRPLGGRVVIGIDELDKLGDAQEAERFLNDLKVIFGIRGCHFLVAVSEDALTAFGRSVLDVRTTFDSAFDRVVAVRPLGVDQARALLELRGVWLPEPYLWLCQILSGGLPRDLLRGVMSLATTRALRDVAELAPLASELIQDDARTVLSAQTRFAASLAGDEAPAVARWIADASQAPVTAADWEALIQDAPTIPPQDYRSAHTVSQVRAYLALGATLIRTFVEGDTADTADTADVAPHLARLRAAGPDAVDLLTTARAKLAVEPEASWAAVARYRRAIPGLAPLP
ncbi:NACHT domain-containing protein [Streptomyces sp. NPDC050085]|uniref:NACHT domain-containing protein n=1 Tax=Streptomyces sp. NPDC050085 TaxID=3365600 RepID=UPI0037B01D49